MSRLPQSPALEWKSDGTPVARAFDDVYFSVEDGLEESRTVFLRACDLPERWKNKKQLTIAETGFGTGLNFLAAWQAWDNSPRPVDAWLDFVSFEGFPPRRADAAKSLSHWTELAPYTKKLLAAWPHPARGTRRIVWPEHRIRLTLHIDEIEHALPKAIFSADAWFLDGFSPAKNDTMWGDWIYPLIAERSATGAKLGTFTVAGHVRRGLQAAGFEVTKAPGHGRKRQRLEATLTAPPLGAPDIYALKQNRPRPLNVAVIGAGIAGASVAHALTRAGLNVSVFDVHETLAGGASGNPLALLMPRLDAEDNPTARLLTDAYIYSREAYGALDGIHSVDVTQTPRSGKERARFEKLWSDPPLPLDDLEQIRASGLLHKNALIIEPEKVIAQLLEQAKVTLGRPVVIDLESKTVNGAAYDAIVLANGMKAFEQLPWLKMTGRLGQVDYVNDLTAIDPFGVAAGHYALGMDGVRLWGATFEDAPEGPAQTSQTARDENLAALKALSPWWLRQIEDATIQSRAGIRATTSDRLPLVGTAIDEAPAREAFASYKHGRIPQTDAPTLSGIFISAGFGSRGFTWGPWAGEVIASQMLALPAPSAENVLACVSPMRLILRAIKRGL